MGKTLSLDLAGGDEFFLKALYDYGDSEYLCEILASCPPEMTNFLLFISYFSHWKAVGDIQENQ